MCPTSCSTVLPALERYACSLLCGVTLVFLSLPFRSPLITTLPQKTRIMAFLRELYGPSTDKVSVSALTSSAHARESALMDPVLGPTLFLPPIYS